jgi:hypothetical protein
MLSPGLGTPHRAGDDGDILNRRRKERFFVNDRAPLRCRPFLLAMSASNP